MTDIPNCSTCPYCDKNTGTWDYCNKADFPIEPLHTKEAIEILGCMEHPDARAYLMAPVIEELEEKYDKLGKDRDAYHEGVKDGYDHAISLIRGGVK
jgi:hypothetical protein